MTADAAMRAAVYHNFGSPDVVTVADVPRPVPQGDEVLIRVHAATVGVVDSLARRGSPAYARVHFGLRRPRFAVLGSDFAGQVEAAGPAVTRSARFGSRKAVVAFTGLRAASDKRKDLGYIRELTEAGALTAVIDAAYPLQRITDAYRRVDAGHKRGNVVVTMTES